MRRNTEWEVTRRLFNPAALVVMAKFRDRHGTPWYYTTDVAAELVEDDPVAALRMVASTFKSETDRRYDDPFAFWPYFDEGRWSRMAAPALPTPPTSGRQTT